MPTRIVYIIAAAVPGGAERQLLMLLSNIDRELFEPSILTFKGGAWENKFRELGLSFSIIDFSKGKLRVVFDTAIWLVKKDPELVHTYGHTANYLGRLAAVLAGIPIIVAGERSAVFFKGRLHRLLDRFLIKYTAGVISNSRHAAKYYVKHRLINPEKIFVVKNGFDASKYFPSNSLIVEVPRRLTYVADLRKEKNHIVLLKAFALIKEIHPDLELHLAGDGELRVELELLVSELNIVNSVIFHGFIDDVHDLLLLSTIYVHPSLYEGMPNAVMEAMALSLPCVVANNAGCMELITDGINGLVFDRTDPAELARVLCSVLEDPTNAKLLGRAARHYILTEFSIQRMVKSTCDIYDSLCSMRDC